MVKQDFKNNPVIGMSTAALLEAARNFSVRPERRGAIRSKSHLALEMKTFSRLLWLMSHITEAKIDIFGAFLLLSSLFFVSGRMFGLQQNKTQQPPNDKSLDYRCCAFLCVSLAVRYL